MASTVLNLAAVRGRQKDGAAFASESNNAPGVNRRPTLERGQKADMELAERVRCACTEKAQDKRNRLTRTAASQRFKGGITKGRSLMSDLPFGTYILRLTHRTSG